MYANHFTEPLFHVLHQQREQEGDDPIDQRNGQVGLPIGGVGAGDGAGGIGQIRQPMAEASDESLTMAMALLPSGGSMRRKACGKITWRMVLP